MHGSYFVEGSDMGVTSVGLQLRQLGFVSAIAAHLLPRMPQQAIGCSAGHISAHQDGATGQGTAGEEPTPHTEGAVVQDKGGVRHGGEHKRHRGVVGWWGQWGSRLVGQWGTGCSTGSTSSALCHGISITRAERPRQQPECLKKVHAPKNTHTHFSKL
eukprot:COSAG01_NODE_580_length_15231_cov_6.793220_2_plen_158_part_00